MKNSTNTILTVAVILLLLVNIAMVVFMVKGKRKGDRREGGRRSPVEMMSKELGMTEQQKKDYEQLRETHFSMMRPLHDSVRMAKSTFFGLVKDSTVTDSMMFQYSERIAAMQQNIDQLTFAHFRRVRNLFSGDQQKKFDTLVQKMMHRSPGRKKESEQKKD